MVSLLLGSSLLLASFSQYPIYSFKKELVGSEQRPYVPAKESETSIRTELPTSTLTPSTTKGATGTPTTTQYLAEETDADQYAA